MKVRHPPGRAGRLWLQHRQAVAGTGAELLDKKRRALVQEHRRLQVLARKTQEDWTQAAGEAQTWVSRAAVLAGDEKLKLLEALQARAGVSVRWRSSMGVPFASEARVEFGITPHAGLGGSAAADIAARAARRAVEAAVHDAAARSALQRIGGELAVTSRRQRALEKRWVPALAASAARLNEMLDELEREEATRSLWVRNRRHGRHS